MFFFLPWGGERERVFTLAPQKYTPLNNNIYIRYLDLTKIIIYFLQLRNQKKNRNKHISITKIFFASPSLKNIFSLAFSQCNQIFIKTKHKTLRKLKFS